MKCIRAFVVKESDPISCKCLHFNDIIGFLQSLPEVILGLLSNPAFRAPTKSLGKPNGHFRRNPETAIEQCREGLS